VKILDWFKKKFRRKETPAPRPKPAPIKFKWPTIKFPKPKPKPSPKPSPAPDPPGMKKKYKKLRDWILDYELWDERDIREQLAEKIKNWDSFDKLYQDDFVNAVEDTFA